MTGPPKGMKGKATGSEPVASKRCSQAIRCVLPPARATSTVLPSTICACAWTSCTPFFLSKAATPPVSFLTMSSFHPTVVARLMAGDCALMPSGEPAAYCASLWNSSAAWIRALDGMQPMFRQVPPTSAASTSTVGTPNCPARIAATYPPGPAPTISSFVVSMPTLFNEQHGGAFEQTTHLLDELRRVHAVHHPVIKRRR